MKLLFVGLGRMGAPMAGHLLKKGHDLSVLNRTPEKAEKWAEVNKSTVHTEGDIYDAVILCVGKDEDVKELLTGRQNLLDRINPGGLIIDHTTTSVNLAINMAKQAKQKGINFFDAPVSGGEIGAQKGQLACMVGGDKEIFPKVQELVSAYCKKTILIGEAGTGQAAKMANQFCIAGTLAGLSEAIHLLEKEKDLNLENVFNAISGGAAQSWQMDNRFLTMMKAQYGFGFGIDLMIKDLGYALKHAKNQGWLPDVAEMVYERYQNLSKDNGMGTFDTSCLLEFYRNRDIESEPGGLG